MYDAEELARLLTEARKGNKQAIGAMLAQLRPEMRRRAEWLLGERLRARMDGSDIIQDVHIRAVERFDQFQGDAVAQLRVWLEMILRTVIADWHRRHYAHKRDASREKGGGDLIAEREGDGTTPSEAAMRIEDQAQLTAALQSLPEKQRQVFQLRFAGLPFEEVARQVDVTVNNARVLMVRATERLTKELGDDHE